MKIAILAVLLPCAAALAAEPNPQSVLLLRNGEVISGEISRAGDQYDVTLKDGELRIKTADVLMWCPDLEEIYARRRAAIDPDRLQDRLDLADWCLRQDLRKQAALELAAALSIDAHNPKVALLDRRLQSAIDRENRPAAAPVGKVDRSEIEQLDNMVRAMPHGSMEVFTGAVQPLLMNRCSNASCHGPQATSSFKLVRIPPGKTPNRRLTQRNLSAALTQVNREHPEKSPLLLVPTAPHGGGKLPLFTTREAAQYQQLVRWAYAAASQGVPPNAATVEQGDHALLQTLQSSGAANKAESQAESPFGSDPQVAAAGLSVQKASAVEVEATSPRLTLRQKAKAARKNSAKPAPGHSKETLPTPAAQLAAQQSETKQDPVHALADEEAIESFSNGHKPIQHGAASSEFVPKDPFDPEIFNRRFANPQK